MATTLNANAIITLAEIKDFLNIPTATTTHDDFLTAEINSVSNSIEGPGMQGIDNKVVSCVVTDEQSDGNGRVKLRTLFYPIIGLGVTPSGSDANKTLQVLAGIRYYDSETDTWVNVLTDEDDYRLRNPRIAVSSCQNSFNIELLNGDVFPEGIGNIKNTYRAGYSTVPADLVEVCRDRVIVNFKNSDKPGGGRFGVNNVTISQAGGTKTTSYKDLMGKHNEILKAYRRRY